jgi:hypothetical protein
MVIDEVTGKFIDEKTLRDESAARGHPPGYDPINGTYDADIPTMLNDHGVPNNGVKYDPTMAEIENGLKGGKPVIIGLAFRGHWTVVDGVRTNEDGSKTLLIRDPGYSGSGGCREVDAAELEDRLLGPAARADGSCIVTLE